MNAAWLTVMVVALAGCGMAQRSDPDASEKRYLLGADYLSKGAVRPALEELIKAVELNPENPEAHHLLGIVFLRQGADTEEMLDRLNCLRGEEAKLEQKDLDDRFRKAESQFREAVRLRPQFSEAWNSLAVVEMHFQRWRDAIESASKALSNITYAGAWAAQGNLGWAYYQVRDLPRATKELRAALYTNPRFCVGRYRLAKVFYDQQEYDEARGELEKLAADKECPIQEAWHLLGLVALRKGGEADRARAAEAFHHCVEMAPKSCLARQCRIAER